jgi:hypothetical protein
MRDVLARSRAIRCYLLTQSWMATGSPEGAAERRAETEEGTLQCRPDRRDALIVLAMDAEEQVRVEQEIKREGAWVWLDDPVVSTDLVDRELASAWSSVRRPGSPEGRSRANPPCRGGGEQSETMGDNPPLAETLHRESEAVMSDATFASLLGMRTRREALMLQAAEVERAAAAVAGTTAADAHRADFLRQAAWKFLGCDRYVQAGALIEITLAENPPEGIAQHLLQMRDRVRVLAAQGRSAPSQEGA